MSQMILGIEPNQDSQSSSIFEKKASIKMYII